MNKTLRAGALAIATLVAAPAYAGETSSLFGKLADVFTQRSESEAFKTCMAGAAQETLLMTTSLRAMETGQPLPPALSKRMERGLRQEFYNKGVTADTVAELMPSLNGVDCSSWEAQQSLGTLRRSLSNLEKRIDNYYGSAGVPRPKRG